MNKPPYELFPMLHGERILLRKIVPEDVNDIIDISFYDAKKASSAPEALQMLGKINQDYLRGESIHWGIIDKSSNKIAGTCGYYRGFNNECGELGCILLPQFQGFGFMTNALKLSIAFGMNKIYLKRIIAITSPQNIKAMKLCERLGFIKKEEEGTGSVHYEYLR